MVSEYSRQRPISGQQIHLAAGDYEADIATVGASLRTLTYRGRDLVAPFDAEALRPVYRGAVLVPWPNRIADGRYIFDGAQQQIAINEPERRTALHGLAVWADWTVASADAASAVLEYRIPAQEAYPFDVLVSASYRLDAGGLHWSVRATNLGDARAPYGLGSHAYLVAGPGRVDDWTLTVPADQVLEVTADRLLPVGTRLVDSFEGGVLDFRGARAIEKTFIDHAFTGVTADESGVARVEVRSASGAGVAMVWDPVALPWVQVHTADRPEPELDRSGLAVEPMTCPPDAFNSGEDLIVLEPGASHEASWQIHALARDDE
ncbi:aldose-1-epimerase [Brooklawnia sp.]|uniref:aldose-1-epimerase n=1 Tax=Brooklawnia sp. TaxID=2699740 RepID=UPI003120020B